MRPSNRVAWFVEKRGVTLCSGDGSVSLSIPYPQAGLWALIANGNYHPASAAELMSILMQASRPEAKLAVEQTLAKWRLGGLLSED